MRKSRTDTDHYTDGPRGDRRLYEYAQASCPDPQTLSEEVKKYEFYMAVPSDITGVERRAFYDLMLESFRSVKEVRLCPKPMADAVGRALM